MSNVLQFPARAAEPRPPHDADRAPRGEILLFTGIRYSRESAGDIARTASRPEPEQRQG